MLQSPVGRRHAYRPIPSDLPSARSRGMRSKPEPSLGLVNPSQVSRCLSRSRSRPSALWVLDAVTLAVGLDRLYATIPRLALGRVARVLAKLA